MEEYFPRIRWMIKHIFNSEKLDIAIIQSDFADIRFRFAWLSLTE